MHETAEVIPLGHAGAIVPAGMELPPHLDEGHLDGDRDHLVFDSARRRQPA